MSTKKRPTTKAAKKPAKAKPVVVAAPSAAFHTNPARAAVAARRR